MKKWKESNLICKIASINVQSRDMQLQLCLNKIRVHQDLKEMEWEAKLSFTKVYAVSYTNLQRNPAALYTAKRQMALKQSFI